MATIRASGPPALLRDVARLHVRAQRERLACASASVTQCTILTELARAQPCTLAELTRRLRLDKGWTSRAVGQLVRRRLIRKAVREDDRRTVALSLTPAGAARHRALEATLDDHVARVIGRIPRPDRAGVTRALQLLLAAYDAELADPPGRRAPGDAAGTATARPSVTIRRASLSDWQALAALLTQAALPLDGAREHLRDFLLAEREGVLAGVAAVERYGTAGLLRSVAVAESLRGRGVGALLVERCLADARAKGLSTVVLLTTTAAPFFRRFGFERVHRSGVPRSVRASAELRGACPASATIMSLSLAPSRHGVAGPRPVRESGAPRHRPRAARP